MSTWLVHIKYINLLIDISNCVNFQSFADKRCSGKEKCYLKVHELVEHFQPCPLELSSYLSAAHICIHGNNLQKDLFIFVICKALLTKSVQGKLNCELHVINLLNSEIRTSPLELSSYLETCKRWKLEFTIYIVNLHSFADEECSGKKTCQFHVTELVRRNIKPCPLELTSYLEASQICVPSKIQSVNCYVNLQSFADGKCSGKSSCQFYVTELVRSEIRPCPLELSSYLEATSICIPGISYFSHKSFNFFWISKLCWWYVLWTDIMPVPCCWNSNEKHQTMPSRVIFLPRGELYLYPK